MTSRSESNVLYNFEYQCSKNKDYEDEILDGSATSILKRDFYVEMKVSSQNDRVLRQTDQYFIHFIAKVKRCMMTCILNTLTDATGYISRVGVFDDHNDKTTGNDVGGCGYFFALIDGILNIGIRNGDTDNGTDTLIPQSSFNCNTVDVFDWHQMYTYEIEYSSKGDAYFSINTGNGIILVHYYSQSDDRTPTVLRLNLPIRYEITKTGNQGNNGEMRQYASHLCLESKFHHCDKPYSCQNISQRGKYCLVDDLLQRGHISVKESTGNVGKAERCFKQGGKHFIPLFSIRLKADSNRKILKYFNIMSYVKQGTQPFVLTVLKNPTFISTGNGNGAVSFLPNWISVSNCSIEYDTNAKDISQCSIDLNILKQEYFDYDSYNTKKYDFNNSYLLDNIDIFSSSITGEPHIYTFAAQRINATIPDVLTLLNWIE